MSERDPIRKGHLLDGQGFTPPIYRAGPGAALRDLVRRYWVPVWELPPGQVTGQRVLQYPVCQLVIADSYAHLVGPRARLSIKELTGSGWAFGVMLQPAAGVLLAGRPVREIAERDLELADLAAVPLAQLIHRVRRQLSVDPHDRAAQARCRAAVEEALAPLLPVDEEGLLANAVVQYVETDPRVHRVGQICARFDITERSLQRLCLRRIGMTPKWLVQRRRLHEAASRLREPRPPALAELAVELGYADQAHFSRDFRAVTGLTPGEFAAEPLP